VTATGGELRIATWNVWWRFGSNWQARQPAILETLRDIDAAQAQAVTNLVTDPAFDGPMPVVLAGDLNAVAGSPVLRPLEDVLIDTWAAGGGDLGAVTIPSSHPEAPVEAGEQIDQRVDHVFVRPGRARQRITVTSASVIDGIANGVHASDHKAVVIDLVWTDG
jgi:endonuclease/exonuclease/phosphatase family metal-dependent hydrolase